MSEAAAHPEHHPRHGRVRRLLEIVASVIAIGAIAALLGWDISAWFSDLWDVLTQISIGYIIAGLALKTVQTVATATGWYWILRVAYGRELVPRRAILACYATAVALNGVPAGESRHARPLLMFTAIVAGPPSRASSAATSSRRSSSPRQRLRLPLPLHLRHRLVRHQVRLDPRALGATIVIIVSAVVLVRMLIGILRRKLLTFWQTRSTAARPRRAANVLPARLPARLPRLVGGARRHRRLPRRVCDPGHLPHDHDRRRRELDRERRLVHAGRRRRQPGIQRRRR